MVSLRPSRPRGPFPPPLWDYVSPRRSLSEGLQSGSERTSEDMLGPLQDERGVSRVLGETERLEGWNGDDSGADSLW